MANDVGFRAKVKQRQIEAPRPLPEWKLEPTPDPEDKAHVWGDDIVSNFFRNISNQVFIPFWNGAMEYDFIRAGVLLIIAGMLLGIGASIVMPKKQEGKGN